MEMELKQLEALIATLKEGGVTEFEYEDESYRIRLGRGQVTAVAPAMVSSAPPSASPASIPTSENDTVFVTSPFVGTFYRAASPDAEPFVTDGATISKGQALCIVEAMKLMNEIEAEFAGTIVKILVENGQSVEYGQKLFEVRKS